MSRSMRYFLWGMMSVFTLERVRLFVSDDIDIESEFKNIRPFASDADAIRHDFENIGRDIHKAIKKYEQEPQ